MTALARPDDPAVLRAVALICNALGPLDDDQRRKAMGAVTPTGGIDFNVFFAIETLERAARDATAV